MVNVVMVILSLVLPLVHLPITKGPWTRRNVLRVFLLYAFVFNVGAVGFLFGFIPHVFFADQAAELIGWPTGSMFQFEVGLHDGGWGIFRFLMPSKLDLGGKKMNKRSFVLAFLVLAIEGFCIIGGCNKSESSNIPQDITAIFDKPLYKNSIWGLRVVDLDTGKVFINLRPDYDFFIGSVRKVFSVGELMNKVGAEHTSVTP